MSEPIEIFKATYNPENKKIELDLNASHIPMLCYCLKLLDLQITDKILEAQLQGKSDLILPNMGMKI